MSLGISFKRVDKIDTLKGLSETPNNTSALVVANAAYAIIPAAAEKEYQDDDP